MRKYMIACACAFALAACGEKPMATEEIHCGGMDITVSVYKNRIDTVIGGHKATFAQTEVASGTAYAGMIGEYKVTFWSKGQEWAMVINDEQVVACLKK